MTAKYTEANRPQNQLIDDGVIVDPKLREGFDDTPNDARPAQETEDWFGLPYVITNGDYFMVRCLDGGAWDRSTMRGSFDTMEEAIRVAKQLS